MQDGVFVSYRHDDEPGYARSVYDRLKSRFPGRIFMDVGEIACGSDFVSAINARLFACKVLIALVGRNWDPARLQDTGDFVRLEISTALKRGVRVIPVLVRGGKIPLPPVLPLDMVGLPRLQALEITDATWDYGCDQLISIIEQELGKPRRFTKPVVGAAMVVLIAIVPIILGRGYGSKHNQNSSTLTSVRTGESSTKSEAIVDKRATKTNEDAPEVNVAGYPSQTTSPKVKHGSTTLTSHGLMGQNSVGSGGSGTVGSRTPAAAITPATLIECRELETSFDSVKQSLLRRLLDLHTFEPKREVVSALDSCPRDLKAARESIENGDARAARTSLDHAKQTLAFLESL